MTPGPRGPRGKRGFNGFLPYVACFGLLCYVFFTGNARDDRQERAVTANCAVVGVLIDERADRDESVQLFGSIRKANPELFDKLIAKAERGDKKIKQASKDLSCDVK